MKLTRIFCMAAAIGVSAAQTGPGAVLANLDTAQWTHDKGDPPGSEGVMLRADPKTGGIELLVRFPGGHVIAPHRHESNERIIVLEGQLTLRQDSGDTALNPGGFAFLPAREVQRLSCTAKTRCTFYLAWDGKPATHPAK
ncbi:MAG TPA: cupin domain-containing protein [Bryobacteraceae bacterium]|jgi:quercetin dioxygenase-like cupin family protein